MCMSNTNVDAFSVDHIGRILQFDFLTTGFYLLGPSPVTARP